MNCVLLTSTTKVFTYVPTENLKCLSQEKPAALTSYEHLGVQLICSLVISIFKLMVTMLGD